MGQSADATRHVGLELEHGEAGEAGRGLQMTEEGLRLTGGLAGQQKQASSPPPIPRASKHQFPQRASQVHFLFRHESAASAASPTSFPRAQSQQQAIIRPPNSWPAFSRTPHQAHRVIPPML